MPNVPQAAKNREIAADINKKIKNFLSWREPHKQKWDRLYKLYRSYLEKKNYPWQSNIFVPYAFSTVETIVPRLVSSKPQIDIIPREKDDELYAEVQGKLIDFQWDRLEMENKMPDIIRQCLIFGTVILKVGWNTQIKKKTETYELSEDLPLVGDAIREIEYEDGDPTIEMVDLYDFFWDPNGYSIETCSWAGHRVYRSYDYLMQKQKEGIYKNVQLLEQESKKKFVDQNDFQERFDASLSADPTNFISGVPIENNIEVFEYHEDDRIITLANRKVIIREEKKNPFNHGQKGYVRIVDQSVPKEFLGIGEIEPIETLQYELNDMRNQRMDNAVMILNRMYIVDNNAGVDEDELVSDIGGVIHTDDINGIVPVQQGDLPHSSYREETLIKSDIQQTTGITDYTKGVASDALANETATGISLMQEAGNSRLRLKMMNIEFAIKKIGELIVSMNAQMIESEKVIRIIGDNTIEWATIKPQDLKDNFDVRAQAGSTLEENDAIKRKQALEMYQLFAGDPDINQIELKRRVFQSRNEKNIDKLFNTPSQEEPVSPQGNRTQSPLSDIPGGVAGLPGNSDRNAEGVMQEAMELNRNIQETA